MLIRLTFRNPRTGHQLFVDEIDAYMSWEEVVKNLVDYKLIPKPLESEHYIFEISGRGTRWKYDETLADGGVQDGDIVTAVIAKRGGGFAEDSAVLTPSGTPVPIQTLKSGDWILAYDSGTRAFRREQIRGIYVEPYLKQIIVNKVLCTTPDQHLLMANHVWMLASQLQISSSLAQFPFGARVVESIEERDMLAPMYSLTLPNELCIVVEGVIARDLIGKQAKIRRPPDIFLSYSSTVKEEARHVYEFLVHRNISVFMAEKSVTAGDSWEGAIREALRTCNQLWLLMSPESLTSEWVMTEWAVAWALEKKIVPVLFRCAPNDLPKRLQSYQCIDLHKLEDLPDSFFLH